MRYMTRSLTKYYLDRMLLIWSKKQTAKELRVTTQTLHRWVAGELPGERELKTFERAFKRLTQELIDRGGQLYPQIADALLYADPPRADIIDQRLDLRVVERRARDLMALDGKVKSTDLYEEFLELGYTRAQITYICRDVLEYKRKVIGSRGRNSYTIWRER